MSALAPQYTTNPNDAPRLEIEDYTAAIRGAGSTCGGTASSPRPQSPGCLGKHERISHAASTRRVGSDR